MLQNLEQRVLMLNSWMRLWTVWGGCCSSETRLLSVDCWYAIILFSQKNLYSFRWATIFIHWSITTRFHKIWWLVLPCFNRFNFLFLIEFLRSVYLITSNVSPSVLLTKLFSSLTSLYLIWQQKRLKRKTLRAFLILSLVTKKYYN